MRVSLIHVARFLEVCNWRHVMRKSRRICFIFVIILIIDYHFKGYKLMTNFCYLRVSVISSRGWNLRGARSHSRLVQEIGKRPTSRRWWCRYQCPPRSGRDYQLRRLPSKGNIISNNTNNNIQTHSMKPIFKKNFNFVYLLQSR